MPEYLSPGVYVETVDRGPKPIQGVGTAMPAFVGFTEKAQSVERRNGDVITTDLLNKPQLVTNWGQFVERFGSFVSGAYLPHSVYGFFQNGGSRCYVVSVRTMPKATGSLLGNDGKAHLLVTAKQAGFDGMKLRVRVDAPELPAGSASAAPRPAPKKGKEGDATETPAAPTADGPSPMAPFTIYVEREGVNGGWSLLEERRDVTLHEVEVDGKKDVRVAYKNNKGLEWVTLDLSDGAAPLDKIWPRTQQQTLNITTKLLAAPTTSEFQGEVTERTGVEGLEALDDVTMVVVPDLMTTMPGQELDIDMVKGVQTNIIAHCERMGDRMAILDVPPHLKPQDVKKWRMDVTGYDSSFATMYYPWIEIPDPITNRPVHVPPSGYIAGVWARTDNTRGVHKAPANEVMLGVTGLQYGTTKGEQDTLNPIGVNCIRAFPGRGIRIWGARTLSSDPAWRYLSIRRLFNYVGKSIELSTQWTVFEPNDQRLWAKIRRDVKAFLTMVWRDGALFGTSPEQAFYVSCDETTNPPEVRDAGQCIIEIGMSPVKPAEFVIFRISQWAGPGSE